MGFSKNDFEKVDLRIKKITESMKEEKILKAIYKQ